jgi:hypothetical protein
MPNWCVNQVDIQGDEAEVARLIEFVKSDESAFTFEKVVPPPTTPMYSSDANHNKYVCGCESVAEPDPKNEGKFVWVIDGKAVGFYGKCPTHNEPSFGNHPHNWYNWNIENWGTKWSAGEVWHDRADDDGNVDGTTSYNFDTAWSPAEPVIAALATQFPTLRITHRYCEAGMGYAGEVLYADGDEIRREEYDMGEMPDGAFTEDWDRDYDKVPMNSMERFCKEHFGGVVGG